MYSQSTIVPQFISKSIKTFLENFRLNQGRIQDFHLGGGGGAQKVMCQHAHYERGTELTFGRGPGPT